MRLQEKFEVNEGEIRAVNGRRTDNAIPKRKMISYRNGPVYVASFGSNPAHGKVYLIQHYVIKFICDL